MYRCLQGFSAVLSAEVASSISSASNKDERLKPASISLPSTMLTPIPALPSPTIDISSLKHSSHSPPSSSQATPTALDGPASSLGTARWLKQQREGGLGASSGGVSGPSLSTSSLAECKNSVATQSGNIPLSSVALAVKPSPLALPHHFRGLDAKKTSVLTTPSAAVAAGAAILKASEGGPSTSAMHTLTETHVQPPQKSAPTASLSTIAPLSSLPSLATISAASSASKQPQPLPPQHPLPSSAPPPPSTSPSSHPHSLSPVGIVLTPSSSVGPSGTRPSPGGVLVQSQLRGTSHSTVLALPIKCQPPSSPVTQLGSVELQAGIAQPLRSLRQKEPAVKKRGVGGEGEGVLSDEGMVGDVESGGGGSARTDSMGPPVKRVRVTRRTAAEEEHAKQ